jgi:ATP-dependent RNA helicase DeaD
MNIGRDNNADPKWLLPLICRRGHVTKRDIGAIRIFDKDTRFQISAAAAEKFFVAASKPDEKDEGIHFTRAEGAPPAEGTRAPRNTESRSSETRDDKPRYERREREGGDRKPYTPGAYKGGNNYSKGGDKPYVRRPRPDVTADAGPSRRFEPGDAPAPRAESAAAPRAEKKPYEVKKPYEDKKPYVDKKPYGDKKPYAARADKKPYVKRSEDGYVTRPAPEAPREPRPQLKLDLAAPAAGAGKSRAGKPFQKSFADKSAGGPKGFAGKKFGEKKFGDKKFAGKKFGKKPD